MQLRVAEGKVGDEPILKAWENLATNYFFSVKEDPFKIHYGLLRRPDNSGLFWKYHEDWFEQQGFWRIKDCDLPSVSFDVELMIYHARHQPKALKPEDVDIPTDEYVIYRYDTVDAIADGILYPVGEYDGGLIIFSNELYYDHEEDEAKRNALIQKGLDALTQLPDTEEDHDMRRMRVLNKPETVWVFEEPGKVTFMYPHEY